jgi:hypothetical protein
MYLEIGFCTRCKEYTEVKCPCSVEQELIFHGKISSSYILGLYLRKLEKIFHHFCVCFRLSFSLCLMCPFLHRCRWKKILMVDTCVWVCISNWKLGKRGVRYLTDISAKKNLQYRNQPPLIKSNMSCHLFLFESVYCVSACLYNKTE